MPKSWILVSSDHSTFSLCFSLNHWQTSDGAVHVLSWAGGTCGRCTISVLQCSNFLPIVFLVTEVQAALRSLTRSSCVVLGWFLTVLMIIDTLRQWFSKCGTRTTSGTWDSSSGTQRNLRINYKSGRVSTKAIFFLNWFKWERLFHAEHSAVFFLAPRI